MSGENGRITIEGLQTLLPNAVLLPIHAQNKGPIYKWRKISFAQSRRPRYQQWLADRPNTGVVLGKASHNLCAIDIDVDEEEEIFLALNPSFEKTLRSKGKHGCQFWIEVDGDYPHQVAKLKDKDGKPFGEWRADGGQSVIRGIHPDGEHYQLLCEAPPLRIRFDQIHWPSFLVLPWKKEALKVEQRAHTSSDQKGLSERVRAYLAKADPAIEGSDGSGTMFKVACVLVWGFGLDPEQALLLLSEYNARCQPPWSEKELRHKLDDVLKVPHEKRRCHLLEGNLQPYTRERQREPANNDALPQKTPPFAERLKQENGDEQEPPDWEKGLSLGMCSSEQLAALDIKPPEPLVADWLRVGDLGFIFALRGLGKTWFAMELGHVIAQHDSRPVDFGPWKVHRCAKVFYLDGEMPPGDIKTRDYALGVQTKNLVYENHEILFQRTGLVMNLADRSFQKAVLSICEKQKFEVLMLDNLSTLTSGVDENKGLDWEIIQPWLLELRRLHITVIFIHHAGRNNEMRGHSKREDPSFWVIRLDAPTDPNDKPGARFFSRFTKWRGATQKPATYEWSYMPVGEKEVCVEFKEASPIVIFKQLVESGLNTNTDLAIEMNVSKGYISQLATKAKKDGWLEINGRKYTLKD